MEYLELIIKILKREENINSNENIKEINLKLDSNEFYSDAFNYLLYHNNNRANLSEKDKYFIENLIDIIKILYKTTIFNSLLNYKFLKLIIFILVKFFVSPFKLSNELIFELFYGFSGLLQIIGDKSDITKEINKFENQIFNSMEKCLSEFFIHYDTYLKNISIESYKKDNINDINILLNVIKLENPDIKFPLYLKGFMEYESKLTYEKYIIIKIYTYLEKINDYNDSESNDYLNTGYALYSIISKKKVFLLI